MATYFEVFDASGQLVSGRGFATKVEAEIHATDAELVAEFGECHAGIACTDHDEHESTDCPYCDAKQACAQCGEKCSIVRPICDDCDCFRTLERSARTFTTVAK